MGRAIGQTLPIALGLVLSPVPVIAVILMLFSSRAKVNGPAFLSAWMVTIAAVTAITIAVADLGSVGTDTGSNHRAGGLRLALGIVLLFGALRRWRKRPQHGEDPTMPRWMAGIETFSPLKAFGLGVILVLAGKNLLLAIAGGTAISSAGVSGTEQVAVTAIFVLLSSIGIALLVGYYLFGGAGARHHLDRWKAWLEQNNAVVMAALLLVFGVVLVGQGLDAMSA